MLAGAGQATRELTERSLAGGVHRRAGEHGHLGQRIGEAHGGIEVRRGGRHGVAAGERAHPRGRAGGPGGRDTGGQPDPAGAELDVVLRRAAGQDEGPGRRLGRGLGRGAIGAQQLERSLVHARDVVFAQRAQSETQPGSS